MTKNIIVRLVTYSLLLCLMLAQSVDVSARGKKHGNKAQDHINLLDAWVLRTIPGIRQAPIINNTEFLVIWEDKKPPVQFVWAGDEKLQNCVMKKAHHEEGGNKRGMPRGTEYVGIAIAAEAIRKGDTLLITTAGGAPEAGELKNARKSLCFKTQKSGWMMWPVDTIVHHHDLVAP